jgi:hypothetical protein
MSLWRTHALLILAIGGPVPVHTHLANPGGFMSRRSTTCTQVFSRGVLAATTIAFLLSAAARAAELPVDTLILGDTASEQSHQFSAPQSQIRKGTLDEPARVLLPLDPPSWEGGRARFRMKVDPDQPNYLTARFSGDEVTENRLMIYLDGKQDGYRHLGDVEQLDYGTWEPAYKGRFFYNTTPLPLEMTRRKTEVELEIRSSGRIWGYGATFEQYQKNQTEPSRSIYKLYTHTDGCFTPPPGERQGAAPANAPIAAAPGAEVIDKVKERVNGEIDRRLGSKDPISQMQAQLLARAFDVRWTHAYENPKAVAEIVRSLDFHFAAYRKNPRLAEAEPSTWNPDWFGLGVFGEIIALRQKELAPRFDEQIDDGNGGKITRRAAFTEMLLATRDWHRKNRRMYTNQSMLNDLWGIYQANRGVAVLTPGKALPEPEARRYLYEAVGIDPWRDSDPGPDSHLWNPGPHYLQLTAKGLTKELGYVGTYGEVLDLATDIYNATRTAPHAEGDPKLKAQLVKIALARSAMRHPALDKEGNRVMRLEQAIGWRDSHYPGEIAYAQRATRDASALGVAFATGDPHLVGFAQQMLADNQFFASEVGAMADTAQPLRTTIGRLETPEQYEWIKAQPASPHRLPMSWDQPDSVFTDEENGVVAFKRGNELFYASLYWRARFAVNFLARIHHMTPQFDRVAVVREQEEFEPAGLTYTRPNWTNFGFGNGGLKYPGAFDSALAGETLPIARIPQGVPFKAGDESPYAGRAQFYRLRYGSYLIGMNASKDKTFDLAAPAAATDLVSKKRVDAGTLKVAPMSTVVLYLGQ